MCNRKHQKTVSPSDKIMRYRQDQCSLKRLRGGRMCCRTNGSCLKVPPVPSKYWQGNKQSHLTFCNLIWNPRQSCFLHSSLTHTHRGLCSTIPSRSPLSVSGRGGISCLEQEQKVAQDDCSFLLWHAHRAPAGSEH